MHTSTGWPHYKTLYDNLLSNPFLLSFKNRVNNLYIQILHLIYTNKFMYIKNR